MEELTQLIKDRNYDGMRNYIQHGDITIPIYDIVYGPDNHINQYDDVMYRRSYIIDIRDSLSIVEWLVKLGYPLDNQDKYGYTLMYKFVAVNFADGVELLLKYGSKAINIASNLKYTPLHKAAKINSKYIVKILLDNGAQYDAINNDGDMPIHVAANYNALNVIKKFIDHQPYNFNLCNREGNTALHIAAQKCHYKFILNMFYYGCPFAVLEYKNSSGNTVLKHMLEHKVAYSDEYYYLTVRLLLDFGADTATLTDEQVQQLKSRTIEDGYWLDTINYIYLHRSLLDLLLRYA